MATRLDNEALLEHVRTMAMEITSLRVELARERAAKAEQERDVLDTTIECHRAEVGHLTQERAAALARATAAEAALAVVVEDRASIIAAADSRFGYDWTKKPILCAHCDAPLTAEQRNAHWRDCEKHPARTEIAAANTALAEARAEVERLRGGLEELHGWGEDCGHERWECIAAGDDGPCPICMLNAVDAARAVLSPAAQEPAAGTEEGNKP